jgi:daunorubicin resistance ABC transporter membrane protein
VPVQLAASGPAHALRAVKVVFQREMIRFFRSKGRLISGLAQPLLLLFVLGSGLSGLTRSATGGVDFRTFLYPGIVATSTLFTAIFAGISIVWDREFGFLREMLVAPVPRSAILVGKCLGGGAIATLQAVILIALAGLVGVPYDPVMIVGLLALLFLTALAMTAFGLMISARIKKFQAVMPIVQLVLTPMMFLSGSLFPLSGLPAWLTVLTRINPLSYAVEPMRHVVFAHLDVPADVLDRLDPGVTWGGWVVPIWLNILVVAALGAAMLGIAAVQFRRTD